ncbi:MAG: hypothetical protein WCJ94_04300 [bacterium]
MKNKIYFIFIVAIIMVAPLLAQAGVAEAETNSNAPIVTAASPAAIVGTVAIPVTYTTKTIHGKTVAAVLPTVAVIKLVATPEISAQQFEELKSKVDYIKKTLESAQIANNDLSASLRDLQYDLKRIEERTQETKNIVQDMTDLKVRFSSLEEKYMKDKDDMEKANGEIDKIKDNVKTNSEKLNDWTDIMDVLKKGTSNNELEIAKTKKIINDLKLKYGESEGNIITEISRWPYLGFVTLFLSIVAVSVAVAK